MKPDKFRRKITHYIREVDDAMSELQLCLDDLPETNKAEELRKFMESMAITFGAAATVIRKLTDAEISPPRDPIEEEEEEEEEDEEEEDEEPATTETKRSV